MILDTGALIALARGDRRTAAHTLRATERGVALLVPSGCVAQAWRNGTKQARLAAFLRSSETEVAPLDRAAARHVGELLAFTGTSDVVDGHVAVLALTTGQPVLTSDPADIRRLAPRVSVHAI